MSTSTGPEATVVSLPPSEGSASTSAAQSQSASVGTSNNTATAASAASTGTTTGAMSSPQRRKQDEGVLHEVLLELDRERSSRAELEAKVRVLEQDLHSQKRQQRNNNGAPNARDYIALTAEKDGYLQILDALLENRAAFASSSNHNIHQTLPLHVLRMLEVIPWDPRARPHLFGQEQLLEWQMYSSDKSWHKELRYFPQQPFKKLPCIVPQPNQTVGEAPTSSSPPKQCVLTNLQLTTLLNIDKGYPLPKDGGVWKWVGGWRIEKNQNTDSKGWSYSNSIDLMDDQSYYGELRIPQKGQPNLVKRRRKWTRLRVLVDYPQASAMTKEYLKLVAEKAELDVSVEKLSGQLVETKMNLTTLEAEHMSYKEETTRKIQQLERDLSEKKRIMQLVDEVNPTAKESVKELRSVVTQWVSNTVSKRQTTTPATSTNTNATNNSNGSDDGNTVTSEEEDDDLEETSDELLTNPTAAASKDTTTKNKQLMFESLKEKGGGLLEKIKLKGGDDLLEKLKQNGTNLISKMEKNSKKDTASVDTTLADGTQETTVAKLEP